jgi:hypothetical protein
MGEHLIELGDLAGARRSLEQALTTSPRIDEAYWVHSYLGILALCEGSPEATTQLSVAAQLARQSGGVSRPARAAYLLGYAYLAQGQHSAALPHFEEALTLRRVATPPEVAGIQQALIRPQELTTWLARFSTEHPEVELPAELPFLAEAAVPRQLPHRHTEPDVAALFSPSWSWHDLLGDCARTHHEGLALHAGNGRDLWHVNLSAPRVVQPAPSGAYSVETVCTPFSEEQPPIGGLLLWQDEQDYLVLEWGRWGPTDIAFRGCLVNEDLYLGRARLPGNRIWLRLERNGEQVRALCSANGEQWFTAGAVAFPYHEGEQVGMHAIGMIDRTIYHGAYPDGAAIRFESFEVWTDSRDDLTEERD